MKKHAWIILAIVALLVVAAAVIVIWQPWTLAGLEGTWTVKSPREGDRWIIRKLDQDYLVIRKSDSGGLSLFGQIKGTDLSKFEQLHFGGHGGGTTSHQLDLSGNTLTVTFGKETVVLQLETRERDPSAETEVFEPMEKAMKKR